MFFIEKYVAIGRMPEVQCEWRYLTDLLVWSDAKSLGVVVGLRLSSEETTAEVSDGGQRGFAMELFNRFTLWSNILNVAMKDFSILLFMM